MDIRELRPIPPEEHPVSLRRYLLPTESIGYIYAMVMKVIDRRDTGLIVYGLQRHGKTSAILYCKKMLKIELPDVPVRIFSVGTDFSVSEGKFFSLFLEAVKHSETGGTVADKRIRLANYIIDAGFQSTRKIFVLFIDEAQKLNVVHYEWLRDIYDQAQLEGVSLLVILVGQLELHAQKASYIKHKKKEIVSRFMIFEMRFHGIRSYEDFAFCLGCYDTFVFPANSEWPFTRFFMPAAYESGFRIGDYARVLWDAFQSENDRLEISGILEIPMNYFSKAVEILFRAHPECDVADFVLSAEICKQIMTESWYFSSMDDSKEMEALSGEGGGS